MSFLTNEPQTFINIKLTDAGRRQLSLGKLTFTSAVFSDREIDYNVGRTTSFNLSNSRIMSPKDANPAFSLNFGLFAEISTWNESTRFYLTGWMIALIVLSVLFIVGLVISLYMAYKYWR
jgi:hypothetical protein